MPEDLSIVENGQPAGGTPFSSLPVALQNSANQADINWANADRQYYSAQEQQIGPLIGAILALGGGALAPILGPAIAGGLGGAAGGSLFGSAALDTALLSGGSNAFGGLIAGEDPGKALLGGVEGGAGSFLGSQLGNILGGAFGGGSGSTIAPGLTGSNLGGGDEFLDALSSTGAPSASSFVSEFQGTTPLNALGALGGAGGAAGGAGGFGGSTLDPLTVTGSGSSGGVPSIGGGTGGLGGGSPGGPDATSPSGAPANGGGDPNTVDELTVTSQPQGDPLALNPAGLINLDGLTTPKNPLDQIANTDKGKDPTGKLLDDFLKLLGGGGGVVQARPSGGGPGVAGTGGGTGSPATGGGTPGAPGGSVGNPSLPDFGIGGSGGGVGGVGPGLINKSGGGAGAGPAGVGNLKLQSSLAPDIYPWSTMGGS